MTHSKHDGGTPGNAACKKPRGEEKEMVLEVDRGEASGDVASVMIEGGGGLVSLVDGVTAEQAAINVCAWGR